MRVTNIQRRHVLFIVAIVGISFYIFMNITKQKTGKGMFLYIKECHAQSTLSNETFCFESLVTLQ